MKGCFASYSIRTARLGLQSRDENAEAVNSSVIGGNPFGIW